MIAKSITNPNLFKTLDESTHETFYGCDQEWYATEWQRVSGCGPSAASNIVFYLNHIRSTSGLVQNINSKEKYVSLMEEIWEYVTPTKQGISTTKMFYESVLTYTKSKGLKVEFRFCDLSKDKSLRPELSDVLNFLDRALLDDAPVAFLNLSNGKEKNLQRWHWVTIISLEYAEDGSSAFIEILDQG